MRYEFFRALSALRFKSALSAYEPTMVLILFKPDDGEYKFEPFSNSNFRCQSILNKRNKKVNILYHECMKMTLRFPNSCIVSDSTLSNLLIIPE